MSSPADVDGYVPRHGDPSFHVAHYDLGVAYQVEGNHLTGRAELRAVAREDLARFTLDLHGLRVRKVTVDGAAPAKYTHRRGRLVVTTRSEIAAGREFHVVVSYAGTPDPVSDKVLGATGWEELTDGAIVAAQPHGAPSWFPCNDHPGDKASYRISVTVASEYRAVCNGILVAARRGASATTWIYEEAQPMASYLATVQIGRYDWCEIDAAVPMFAAVPRRLRAKYDDAFGRQPEMLAAFSRLFGPYPFACYTVVVTDDDLEIPLESQGLSTFGANHLTPDWDSVRLVAHELAHQWFGNCLTLGRWQDIWLHEGFACYAEWLWSEEAGERTAHERALEHWGRLAELDQDLVLGDPGPELMFDDRVYKRGALLLHALRLTIGDAEFFDLLRSWVKENAGGTVSTEMFIELAEERTRRPLGELFSAWLREEDLPELPHGR